MLWFAPAPSPTPILSPTPVLSPSPSLAPATEQATNNANLALVVAVLAAVASIVVAVINHLTARSRERDRWELEERREKDRWERERAERQEQWEREDAARWHRERLDAYSALLTSFTNFIRLTEELLPHRLDPNERYEPSVEDMKSILEEFKTLDIIHRNIALWAPPALMSKVLILAGECAASVNSLVDMDANPISNSEAGRRISQDIEDLQRQLDYIQTDVRSELGITNPMRLRDHSAS
ncbi:hypothetical protein ACGFJ7_44780 [Actinoplanes sp. NPDC048988]|uniref:hypothetical protein n=1 Tax=Actinoplanes sp. NPDC048988 TaxID=3363901 RepID=UPI003723EA51